MSSKSLYVIILADNDGAGREHAEKKAARIHGIAARVRVVHFSELPEKGDVTDWCEAEPRKSAKDLISRAADAPEWSPPASEQEPEARASDGPIPLIPELAPGSPFPVAALGLHLGEAAAAISRKIGAPVEIAAQSVLACASLAAQALANVRLPFGHFKPLSLFFVTIAASGDRKTAVDREAAWPIRAREDFLASEHCRDKLDYDASFAAWEAEKKRIESERKTDQATRKSLLVKLGPAPLPPLLPLLTAPEPTIEGLIKAWVNAPPALGLFSAEGGQFVGGHGMSQ